MRRNVHPRLEALAAFLTILGLVFLGSLAEVR